MWMCDLYRSVLDCCEFIYPRLTRGRFMVVDDYGFRGCPGARGAVDRYFLRGQEYSLGAAIWAGGHLQELRGPPSPLCCPLYIAPQVAPSAKIYYQGLPQSGGGRRIRTRGPSAKGKVVGSHSRQALPFRT
jgi:Macrocin-O-methyltransferase (TylF)